MSSTIVLDSNWDISLDINGNFITNDGDYAIAQNVANACRAFTQDMYFNQADGIPHFLIDISTKPNLPILAAKLEAEAKKFPEVGQANFIEYDLQNRLVTGDLRLTKPNGEVINVTI